MSRLINNIRGFGRYFNELRKQNPVVFYGLVLPIVIGLGLALGSVFVYGALPYLAFEIFFAGLYAGVVTAMFANILIKGQQSASFAQVHFMATLKKQQPLLFWGLVLTVTLATAFVALAAFIPAIGLPIATSLVGSYLGISALSGTGLLLPLLSIAITTGIAATFVLKGLVDIAQDIGSLCSCQPKRNGVSTGSFAWQSSNNYLEEDDEHNNYFDETHTSGRGFFPATRTNGWIFGPEEDTSYSSAPGMFYGSSSQ